MKKLIPMLIVGTTATAFLFGCSAEQTNSTSINTSKNTPVTNITAQHAQEQAFKMTGTITGNKADTYNFSAQKGQILRVIRNNTSPDIQLNVQYLGSTNSPAGQTSLDGNYQTLPFTGNYQIIVNQTRNDARNHPNATLHYDLTTRIENVKAATNTANITVRYQCDDNKGLTINYFLNGNTAMAAINFQNVSQNLQLDGRYSQPNNPVYSNADYMISVGTPDSGNLNQSTIYSVNSFHNSSDGEIVLQNCQAL